MFTYQCVLSGNPSTTMLVDHNYVNHGDEENQIQNPQIPRENYVGETVSQND